MANRLYQWKQHRFVQDDTLLPVNLQKILAAAAENMQSGWNAGGGGGKKKKKKEKRAPSFPLSPRLPDFGTVDLALVY